MSLVWLNGALLTAGEARIDPTDRGFTLGDGVFETIRADSGEPAHLARHLARLRYGAGVLGIPVPVDDAALGTALRTVAAGASGALRLTLTRGPMPRGVLPACRPAPTILITAAPLPPPLPPARLIVSARTRRNETSPLSRIKSLNYGDSILARQEAAEAGADDALLLNTRGTLAEATASSVFLLIADAIVTPPVSDGALPGIARSLCLEAGLAREASISGADVARAEAGLLVNALGASVIASIGGAILDVRHPRMADLDAYSNRQATLKRAAASDSFLSSVQSSPT